MSKKNNLEMESIATVGVPRWSRRGDWLILFVLLGLSAYVYLGWILEHYFAISVLERLSYIVVDPSYVPPGQLQHEVLGAHYFGDWATLRGWTLYESPYLIDWPAYPPLSLLLNVPFAVLPYTFGAALYLLANLLLPIVSCWLLLSYLDIVKRLSAVLLFVVLTLPMILILDRGNNIGIVFGLFGISLWGLRKTNSWIFIVSATLSIGAKFYNGVWVVPLLARGSRRLIIKVLAITGVFSLLLFAYFPGSLVENILGFSHTPYTGALAAQYTLGSYTTFSLPMNVICLAQGPDAALNFFNDTNVLFRWLGLIVFMVTLAFASFKKFLPYYLLIPLTLASIQFIPTQGYYVIGWAMIAAPIFATDGLQFKDEDCNSQESLNRFSQSPAFKFLEVSVGMAIVFALVPFVSAFKTELCTIRLGSFLSPISMYLMLFALILHTFSCMRKVNVS